MNQKTYSPTDKKAAASLSVLSNTTLVLLKLVVGIFTGSVSVVSEAAHSGVDLLAAVIAYYAVSTSDKKPDSRHTYGHGKIENISGAVEAILIVVAAVWIVFEAIKKLYAAEPPQHLEYGIAIMLVSVAVNIFVSRRLFRVAKTTGSHALEADALHLEADVWTSAGVLCGLTAIQFTGIYWLDPAIAIFVSLIIFKAGFDMTLKSMRELTDVSLPEEEQTLIRTTIEQHPQVRGYHNLRTRRSGSKRIVDVHIQFDSALLLGEVHTVCDELEKQMESVCFPCEMTIHQEPYVPETH